MLCGWSGLIAGGVIFAFISFGIAFGVKGRKVKGKGIAWNAVSQWFFWIALILPALTATQTRR